LAVAAGPVGDGVTWSTTPKGIMAKKKRTTSTRDLIDNRANRVVAKESLWMAVDIAMILSY
jgi:hypothetical protein